MLISAKFKLIAQFDLYAFRKINMIKNIIFDMGNVIFNYDRDYLLHHFYNGKDFDLLKEKTFKNWELLDEDAISLDEYYENVKKELPFPLSLYALSALKTWEYFMDYNKEVISLIQELKQNGYKLFILSNITKHFVNVQYKFPILKEFDGLVFSSLIKVVKPNKEIYEYLLEKYNLNPKECIFIDDTKKNLAGAARFGIKTFHFQSNANDLSDFILNNK